MRAARVYLDYNATAPLRPAARAAMLAALDCTGNPSSSHFEGRAARALVEQARRQVAALVGADPRSVIFTGSATEAANLVLTSALAVGNCDRPLRFLAGATEHPCVLMGHRFERAEVIPVDGNGVLNLAALEASIVSAQGPALLALQAANSETGVLQPVRAAADQVHKAGGLIICDAVQSAGRTPCQIVDLGADALILSSHKIGGPKGAGALIFADPDAHIDAPLLRGGGQERGFRSGTEDVAAIVGFGAACTEIGASGAAETALIDALRQRFERDLLELDPMMRIIGAGALRLPNTVCFGVPGIKASNLLMALDLAGVAVSSGSACSSGKIGRSPVLDAMAIDPHIEGAIRVSFGWNSQAGDETTLLRALEAAFAQMKSTRAA